MSGMLRQRRIGTAILMAVGLVGAVAVAPTARAGPVVAAGVTARVAGFADLVWYNDQTGETQIWFMNEHRLVRRSTVVDANGVPALVGPPFRIVGISDKDEDGHPDIVWHHDQTGETRIWFMKENRIVRQATVVDQNGAPALVGPPFRIVGISEMDYFSYDDIIWYNDQTGETRIWFMGREKILSQATVLGENGLPALVGPPFRIVGISDVNGDGPGDIVWHHDQTGETRIWIMNIDRIYRQATVLGENGQPAFVGPPFRIVGVGDMNSDGYADIVWHHDQTGETRIWFMRGERVIRQATVVGENGQPALVGPPFRIVGVSERYG
ncbi:FG-GAP repeat domain-containing protein [Virgisporangium aurantiacum]|uniref:Repeat domain-containing protein n=1 Tax=Virgisporangium aurantiacum TaxID=175570 RepID=A0A8J3Z740_9ACTN|nr:VCBS repeat-containing protein [Virgisporangium aurantiacum]GIJ57607.1 hypothetical protein Vau01_051230 [Virgisporangium aurantiacum]